MSVIRKKPTIEIIAEQLSDEERESLVSLLNSPSPSTVEYNFLNAQKGIAPCVFTFDDKTVKNGILIYNDTLSYLIGYNTKYQELELIQLDFTNDTYKKIDEYLDINELRRTIAVLEVIDIATPQIDEQSYNSTIQYLNGYSNRSAYINIKRSNGELKVIVSGPFDIDQTSFVVGTVQTPIQFELDEETSRKLYVGDSNTAQGNICAIPALYYNDRTGVTTVCSAFLRRVSDNGNIYTIRFGNNELTNQSTITDFQFRVTLEL